MCMLLLKSSVDYSDKEIENKQAFSNFEHKHSLKTSATSVPTVRDGTIVIALQ